MKRNHSSNHGYAIDEQRFDHQDLHGVFYASEKLGDDDDEQEEMFDCDDDDVDDVGVQERIHRLLDCGGGVGCCDVVQNRHRGGDGHLLLLPLGRVET